MIKDKYGNILQIHQAEITVRNIVYLFNGITEVKNILAMPTNENQSNAMGILVMDT